MQTPDVVPSLIFVKTLGVVLNEQFPKTVDLPVQSLRIDGYEGKLLYDANGMIWGVRFKSFPDIPKALRKKAQNDESIEMTLELEFYRVGTYQPDELKSLLIKYVPQTIKDGLWIPEDWLTVQNEIASRNSITDLFDYIRQQTDIDLITFERLPESELERLNLKDAIPPDIQASDKTLLRIHEQNAKQSQTFFQRICNHFQQYRQRTPWDFCWRIGLESLLVSLIVAIALIMLGSPHREIKLDIVSFVILAIIIAPILETLLFQSFPIWIARICKLKFGTQIAISATLFALTHIPEGFTTFISAGIVGGFYFAFTYAFWRTKGRWVAFWVTALVHAIHNFPVILLILA
ncbi:MAG TPA: hypothetical protein DCM28_02230 [Phycisphaerales bacterium]|nr:hypothetical protein [Phycisphaerales bacterium]HCD33983.1 hypothetical protein [Phycisphaerales bacterium]|tara:strand:- start:618 stop:1661 length:1044 start_codon:yes stop_codon:yes gene_type:complete